MNTLSYVNLFAKDVTALCTFYAETFGFREIDEVRSPIFRALDAGGCRIGINAHDAYQLLNLAEHAEPTGVRSMITIAIDDTASVDRLLPLALAGGARLVKAPYPTAYGSYQAVLFDPEGHVVRIDAPFR